METHCDNHNVIPDKKAATDPGAILDHKVVELYTKSVCVAIALIFLVDIVCFSEWGSLGGRHAREMPSCQTNKILPALTLWAPCLTLANPK